MIIVFSGILGFIVELVYNKVGWNVLDIYLLIFVDVWVLRENLLGVWGSGYVNFLFILDEGWIVIVVLVIGVVQGCVDESVKYVNQCQLFGQLIGVYQVIGFKIVWMEVCVYVVCIVYYDVVVKMLVGKFFKKEVVIVKMIFLEVVMDNFCDVIQIYGGYGFMNEYLVVCYYCDSKVFEIGEGIMEVQLMFIV